MTLKKIDEEKKKDEKGTNKFYIYLGITSMILPIRKPLVRSNDFSLELF